MDPKSPRGAPLFTKKHPRRDTNEIFSKEFRVLAFRYIALHYLKYFFIVLSALVMFLVGFDYMQSVDELSNSINLLLIYLVYKSFYAIDMLLPLSLVFAMISTKIFLIRSNALVSLFSLGYSRVDILRPFVVVSSVVILLFISLHSWSNFARADEFSNNIRSNAQYLNPTRNLFFTYEGQYVYISKLLPLQEKIEGIRIFNIQNDSLEEVLVASGALYRNGFWHIKESDIIKKPNSFSFESKGIELSKAENIKVLEGFRPKILDQIYEGKVNFTISDAISAIILLSNQNVNTSTIKGALYKIFIYFNYIVN